MAALTTTRQPSVGHPAPEEAGTLPRGIAGPDSSADVLLGGRLGQAMLADLAGLNTLMLLVAEGKPVPEGVTFLRSTSSGGLGARLRRPLRPRRGHRDAGTWPEWMNPGGNDAATIIGAAVASTVRASAEQPWFTDPLALLVSVARAAEQWEPPLPGGQPGLLRPLAEAVASAPAARWWWEPADLRHQRWLGCDHHRTGTQIIQLRGGRREGSRRHPVTRRADATISLPWPHPYNVAYSPVNRNSACHGPSTWTTSQ